jgi:hypothetical protein
VREEKGKAKGREREVKRGKLDQWLLATFSSLILPFLFSI